MPMQVEVMEQVVSRYTNILPREGTILILGNAVHDPVASLFPRMEIHDAANRPSGTCQYNLVLILGSRLLPELILDGKRDLKPGGTIACIFQGKSTSVPSDNINDDVFQPDILGSYWIMVAEEITMKTFGTVTVIIARKPFV